MLKKVIFTKFSNILFVGRLIEHTEPMISISERLLKNHFQCSEWKCHWKTSPTHTHMREKKTKEEKNKFRCYFYLFVSELFPPKNVCFFAFPVFVIRFDIFIYEAFLLFTHRCQNTRKPEHRLNHICFGWNELICCLFFALVCVLMS